MKAILSMLVGGALCVAAHEAALETEAKYLHVPLLMWSQRPMFAKQAAYSSAVLDENKVSATLENVLKLDTAKDAASVLSRNEVGFESAEVLCLFLSKNLDAKALGDLAGPSATSFVESAVKDARSSVVLPHTTREGTLQEALKQAKLDAPVVTDVKAWIASPEGKTLLTNGKTDLVVVKIPDACTMPEADALIKSATAALSDATKGKADFAFTGDESETVVSKRERSRRLADATANATIVCEANYKIGYDSSNHPFCYTHHVRMTPNLLSGLVVGSFFVFLGYIGFSAMHGIQTPARYPHHGPPKGKEF